MRAVGWGRIVNIASSAGKEGTPGCGPYSAAKAGVIALTKALGKELAGSGVLVNCLAPGPIETPLLSGMTPDILAALLVKRPCSGGSARSTRSPASRFGSAPTRAASTPVPSLISGRPALPTEADGRPECWPLSPRPVGSYEREPCVATLIEEEAVAAYLIADINVTDPVAFEEYKRRVGPQTMASGGRYLVRGGGHEALEGHWQPDRLVVIEFPDGDPQGLVCLARVPGPQNDPARSTGRLIAVEVAPLKFGLTFDALGAPSR